MDIADPNIVSKEQIECGKYVANDHRRIAEIIDDNLRLFARLKEIVPDYTNETILAIPTHKLLLSQFLSAKCKHFRSVKKAISVSTQDDILMYITEINLYGVFTPQNYLMFVNNFHDNCDADSQCLSFTPLCVMQKTKSSRTITQYNLTDVKSMESKIRKQMNCDVYSCTINNRTDFMIIGAVNIMLPNLFHPYNACEPIIMVIKGIEYYYTLLSDKYIEDRYLSRPRINTIPYEVDFELFENKCCLYFLQMNEPDTDCYKYGITRHIRDRLRAHKRKINYLRVVKIFVLCSEYSMINAEKDFKKYAQEKKINVVRLTYTEVIQSSDPNEELKMLESIINKYNNEHKPDDMGNIAPTSDLQNIMFAENGILDYSFERNWICENPPCDREKKTSYYEKYKKTSNSPIGEAMFGKLMKEMGFKTRKTAHSREWVIE
jgi:predicted GIY-YIG superfamily endonuclease